MRLLRSFSIYTLSSVLAGAVPLLLLPILTRYLTESDYGTAATLTTLFAFFTPPILWGAHALISVEFHRIDPQKFAAFVSTSLALSGAMALLMMAISAVLAVPIAGWLQLPVEWVMLAPLFAALGAWPVLQLSLLRIRDQAWTYGALELASAVLTVAGTIGLVVWAGLSWQGRLVAAAITSAILSALAWRRFRRESLLVAAIDRDMLRNALRFGAGVVPHDLFSQSIRLADRLIIVAVAGLASAGQYAVATQVSSVLLVLLAAFNRAWSPFLFARLPNATEATRIDIVRKSYAAIAAFALVVVVFNAAVPLFYHLLIAPRFHESQAYVAWLSVGYLFNAVYLTFVDYIFYEKKTHILSMITLFNLITNVGLNFMLVGRFGAIGAAYAFAITMAMVMALTFILSNRLHPMPWWYFSRKAT
jgi:O-antigen/teichoic acid export membrane protein